MKLKLKLKLDEKNLSKQPLFWFAIGIPTFLFFAFGLPLWKCLIFDFSEAGYNRFLEINKLPLYLFGTCVPLVAIIGYMHRTIQTESQINNTLIQIGLTESKNKTDSYYSHIKFIIDGIKSLPTTEITHINYSGADVKEKFTLSQPYALYKRMFPKSNLDTGYCKDIDNNFRKMLMAHFNYISNKLHEVEIRKGDNIFIAQSLSEIDNEILDICNLLLLEYNPKNHMYRAQTLRKVYCVSFYTEEQLKITLKHIYQTSLKLCDFVGMDSNSLTPHPLSDAENSLPFYINSKESLFSKVLPATDTASPHETTMGFLRDD